MTKEKIRTPPKGRILEICKMPPQICIELFDRDDVPNTMIFLHSWKKVIFEFVKNI